MRTFEEYQALATRLPLSLRNSLDRINLPALGIQEEAGKIGSLLTAVAATGRINLAPEQRSELHDRLSDMLWYVAFLCRETGIPMQEVADHSIAQLKARGKELDQDQR